MLPTVTSIKDLFLKSRCQIQGADLKPFRVCLSWALGSLSAWAQQPAVDAGVLQQSIQRDLPALASPGLPVPVPAEPASAGPLQADATVRVERFELLGATTEESAAIEGVLRPWLNRTLGFRDLQAVGAAIEGWMKSRGRLVQAVLPPQQITDGVVSFQLLEARLGAVIVDTPGTAPRFDADRAKAYVLRSNQIGQALDLGALSRSLALLGELPGVTVAGSLEAGQSDGQTNVRLSVQEQVSHAWRVDVNNHGSRTTGVGQVQVQGSWLNPSGVGDQISLASVSAAGSNFVQASYQYPLLPNGLRLSANASALRYRNIGEFEPNGSSGDAQVLGLGLSYPALRSPQANANLTLSMDDKSYLNRNLATQTVASSYRIRNYSVGLSGNRYDGLAGGAVTSAQISWVLGELLLRGESPPNFGLYTPAHFSKLTFGLQRNQTLADSGLQLSLSGQYASANLNSAEQFYLGGPYGVRAYPVAQGGGSQGLLAQVEWQRQAQEGWQQVLFLDAGRIEQFKNPYPGWQGNTQANNAYELYGAGAGLRKAAGPWSLSATAAWRIGSNPLYSQSGQAVDVDRTRRNPRLWLLASFRL